MTVPRALTAALLAAAALVLAGCGSASEDTAAGAAPAGAQVAPADSAVFVSIDTDTESDQWAAASALLDKFPSGDQLVQKLLDEIQAQGLDWEADVKPALGPELDLVVLDLPTDGSDPTVVGLTQPRDEAKLEQVLKSGDEPAVSEVVDGWTAIADTQAALDAFDRARESGSLAGVDGFEQAMAGVPEQSLVRLYVNGERLMKALESSANGMALAGVGKVGPVGAAVVAQSDGLRLSGSAAVEGVEAKPYAASLPSEVPANALVYLSFNDMQTGLDRLLDTLGESNSGFDQQLAQAELLLGVSVTDDLLPLFAGEGALVVAPGSPIPAVSLILKVDDEQAAMRTLDTLASRAGAFAGGGAAPTPTTIEGVQAKQLTFGQVPLFYAGFDGKVVVTTSREGIAGLRQDGPKLTDDEAFEAARDAAEMPDETSGFAYVDLKGAIQLVGDYARLSGDSIPPEVSANLEPLGSLLVYSTQEDGRYTFSGFLGID